MKSKTYTPNKQPLDKTQSVKLCQVGVKRTLFQNMEEKRKWFFDHTCSTTLKKQIRISENLNSKAQFRSRQQTFHEPN